MKYMILVGDGMADFPVEALEGQTPLEYARTPEMDTLAAQGILGEFTPIPEGFPPGSDIGNLSLFGYAPQEAYTGRAPLEAANQGILLQPDQVAFRCNLVSLDDGVMASFTAGHISSDEGHELIAALNQALGSEDLVFHGGVGYRNLCVMRSNAVPLDDLVRLQCTPPHNITDQAVEPHLPTGANAQHIREIMTKCAAILQAHPINQKRAASGQLPATFAWLWGQGQAPAMQTYAQMLGRTGAVISAVDLVKGIGVCAGLRVLDVPGATGYIDTNYDGKVAAAIQALDEVDMVYVHIEAPDETAHEGRADLKVQAIEDFDSKVVAPCAQYARSRGDVRLFIAPDHITAISTKTHAEGPVPFIVAGAGITALGHGPYTESAARGTGIRVDPGYQLTRAFLTEPTISEASLRGLTPALK